MGEKPSFDEFVATRSTHLLRTAYLLTHDWSLAEDLLQTTLAKAWPAWMRMGEEPEPYVRRILVNAYASGWRRKWRGEIPHAGLPEVASAGHAEAVAERDLVWQALQRLPRRQRAVVVLRYFEDLPEAHVADLLGISVGTVKSQTTKAFAHLRVDPTLRPETADERT
jgi:RNA polymerase sigma-70 factor (sigma-E family)